MMQLSISEAALQFHRARSTLQRHIRQGKLSTTNDTQGRIKIDLAELVRVYGEPNATPCGTQDTTLERELLREQVAMLKEQITQLNNQLEIVNLQNERLLSLAEGIKLLAGSKKGFLKRMFL